MVSSASQIDIRVTARSERDKRSRVGIIWAWASFVALLLCWDAAARLDQRVSIPRVKIAHAVREEPSLHPTSSQPLTDFE
jgi:hypothetical protein